MQTVIPFSAALPRAQPHGSTTIAGQTSLSDRERLSDLDLLVRKGQQADPDTGASLEAWLTHSLGRRLDMRKKTRATYGRNGYEETETGVEVTVSEVGESDTPVIEALRKLCEPGRPEQIAGPLARMRNALARTAEHNVDIELLADTMIDLCADYPADVMAAVSRDWMKTQKFFPTPCDFISKLDQAVAFRRTVLAAMQTPTHALRSSLADAIRRAGISPTDERLWFKNCRIDGNKLVAPSAFVRDYLDQTFASRLKKILGDNLEITVGAA